MISSKRSSVREPIDDNSHGRLYVRLERFRAVDSKHFLVETKTCLGCSWILKKAQSDLAHRTAGLHMIAESIFPDVISRFSAHLAKTSLLVSVTRGFVGGVSAPFDNMVRRSLVAARTSASGWEGTQRGSHQSRTVAVE